MIRNISDLTRKLPIFRQKTNPFLSIQNSLDKAIDDFYSGFKPLSGSKDWENFSILPAMDVVENDDSIKIELEMPGMGPDDIKIDFSNNILSISGEKHISKKDKEKNYVMREIGYGYYERQIPLAEYLDSDKAEASFRKGMLWITIPKKKGQSPAKKEIKITAA